jgi:hypothetical protein
MRSKDEVRAEVWIMAVPRLRDPHPFRVLDSKELPKKAILHLKKLKGSGREAWENYFAAVWNSSPALRIYISNRSDWYSSATKMWIAERQRSAGDGAPRGA